MTLSTSQLRSAYAPACQARGGGYLDAYAALDAVLEAHCYRVRREDTGAYNCRKITGGSGYSLHAYGPGSKFTFWTIVSIATSLAVDINWQTNPYGSRLVTDMPRAMVDEIEAIRTVSGAQVWRWGGYYAGNKDAMHYEIVCSPADLNTGIRTPKEEDDMATPTEQFAAAAVLVNELFEQAGIPRPRRLDFNYWVKRFAGATTTKDVSALMDDFIAKVGAA